MKRALIVVVVAVVAGAAGYALFEAGARHGAAQVTVAASQPDPAQAPASQMSASSGADRIDPATGRRVLYWHDPMVPGRRFDKPGKSPFMDMQLVPVFADDTTSPGTVSIDPRVAQNLGIRTARVVRGRLDPAIEAVGAVAYNERDVAVVQSRANGWIERLRVRAPLDTVRKGDVLAEVYVPDWLTAQEEFLTVKRMQLGERLVDGARQRMRLAGMPDELVALVESTGKAQPRAAIVAPIGGVVTELAAREGMTVMTGATLFRLNGLSSVWINAEVPETLAASIRPGLVVDATTAALPGKVFKGRVAAVLPEVNATTRTLKARIEVANPGAQLVPGMFATITVKAKASADKLLVPSEAVIRTGRRTLVMVATGAGRYRPVDVETGSELNGQVEIRTGLSEGQDVVASGQFLVDSEASLKGIDARATSAANEPAPATAGGAQPPATRGSNGDVHQARGRIESIAGNELMIEHGPVATLNWPSMTMGFRMPSGSAPPGIKSGDLVQFEFRRASDGQYEIVTVRRITGSPPLERPAIPDTPPAAAPTAPAQRSPR